MLRALAALGHEISFFEPDAYDRQANRDIDPPQWADVQVYAATVDAARKMIARAADADVVVKASGVGIFDDLRLEVWQAARPVELKIFWDVEAHATLAEHAEQPDQPLPRSAEERRVGQEGVSPGSSRGAPDNKK